MLLGDMYILINVSCTTPTGSINIYFWEYNIWSCNLNEILCYMKRSDPMIIKYYALMNVRKQSIFLIIGICKWRIIVG